MDIVASTAAYEGFLRTELGPELVEAGLAEKHAAMRGAAFPFLRATYWRWAETVLEIAPELASAPSVLAVGDIHLENFGTWRDAEGRLVWGVNDFDEAAEMPFALDLLRLATSGLLAGGSKGETRGGTNGGDADGIAKALLDGYAAGLETPGAAVLDRDLAPLRQAVMVPESQRQDFWDKLRKKRKRFEALGPAERPPLPPRYEATLRASLPVGSDEPRLWYRSAGLGSLGRPRWVAQAKWCGDWVIREAKGIIPSGWVRAHGGGRGIRCVEIATGRFRAPDPWYRVVDGIAVRRLSPNNRKIGTDKPFPAAGEGADGEILGRDVLLGAPMLEAMGRDLASIHLGGGDAADRIRRDLAARKRGWLAEAATRAAGAVSAEQKAFAASP